MTASAPMTPRSHRAGPAVLRRLRAGRDASAAPGQALVEFVAVLLPLLFLIVGIVQFGLLFGANVTLTNSAREGARAGTIYVFDQNHTKAWNDSHRCAAILTAATQSFGLLANGSPHFSAAISGGGCSTTGTEVQVDGDLTVAYCASMSTSASSCPDGTDPTTICVPDTRQGCLIQVTLTYRSDIVVPLVGQVLAKDTNGRFSQQMTATMVVN